MTKDPVIAASLANSNKAHTDTPTSATPSPHWRLLANACLGGQPVQAAADQGAARSLITHAAAKRLGLAIDRSKKPWLRPYWGKTALQALGTARARLATSESSRKSWIDMVVADAPLAVELLVGRHQLDQLHLDLCEMPPPASAPVTPDPAPTVETPVRQKGLPKPLGLPATFFTKIDPSQDPEYLRDDARYPAVDQANVARRKTTQAPSPRWHTQLLNTLMTGAVALREYPSGCPPPSRLKPIAPPFRDNAQLLFVAQAPRSAADKAFMEGYVATRLKYGIDEPGQAHANVPVYSIPKPNTEARRVIMDDSVGSSVNMLSVGLQLPRLQQVRHFVRDAQVITSIDLASYFTAIWLAPEHRDFWTFDGGSHGHVRTTRLVQGNSQSPAIAHAFLMAIFEELSPLRGKLLGYIDNIYLKSTTGNLAEHIEDIGLLVRKLAEWNLLLNLDKSVFLGVTEVDILGYRWSKGGAWSLPDHQVASLQALSMPTMVKGMQQLTGGINAIAAHLPWAGAVLAPFYALTGKKHITKAELAELTPYWEELKCSLLDVQHLYEPGPGEPLILQVDASEAGVGAVLLCTPAGPTAEARVVAYWSKAFDGMQGRRHLGFREAWGLLRAVRHFYPYLDGCCNLRIEVDATTALGIFNHKSTCQADELSGIRAELAAMGVHANMIHHRPGETHLTADWLSRCLTRLRPRKVKPTLSDPVVAAFTSREISPEAILSDSSTSDEADSDDDSMSDSSSEDDEDITSDEDSDSYPSEPENTTAMATEEPYLASEARLQQAIPEAWHFTLAKADQLADPQVRHWYTLCEQRDQTTGPEDALFSEVHAMALQDHLLVKWVRGPTGTLGSWVPVTPAAMTKTLLTKWHQVLCHPGYDRLLTFAQARIWCDQLVAITERVSRTCHTCQLNAIPNRRQTPQSTTLTLPGPGEHLYIDFGHFGDLGEPETQFLLMVDAASKYYQVVPLVSITTQDAIEALEHGWLMVYGTPKVITTDNALQFRAQDFQDFLQDQGIRHVHTSTYHPQSDRAERYIGIFKQALLKCLHDQGRDQGWTRYIPQIVAAHAVLPDPKSGITPWTALTQGRLLTTTEALLTHPEDDKNVQAITQHMMAKALEACQCKVQQDSRRFNQHATRQAFSPGQLVTMQVLPKATNLAQTMSRRQDPYLVLAWHQLVYQLTELDGTLLPKTIHGNWLLPYYPADPLNLQTPTAEQLSMLSTPEHLGTAPTSAMAQWSDAPMDYTPVPNRGWQHAMQRRASLGPMDSGGSETSVGDSDLEEETAEEEWGTAEGADANSISVGNTGDIMGETIGEGEELETASLTPEDVRAPGEMPEMVEADGDRASPAEEQDTAESDPAVEPLTIAAKRPSSRSPSDASSSELPLRRSKWHRQLSQRGQEARDSLIADASTHKRAAVELQHSSWLFAQQDKAEGA